MGDEVIQLYVSNRSNSLDLPLRELQGFKRINLKRGEKKTVSFILKPAQFSRVTENGTRLVEPSEFLISYLVRLPVLVYLSAESEL